MQFNIVPLNCRDKQYEFNIVAVREDDWIKFVKSVLLARTDNVSSVSLTGFKVVIRDNIAKVVLYWKDEEFYHEFKFHLDPFGRVSKDYKDLVSEIWQNLMGDYYGEEYNSALEAKLANLNQTI